MLTAEGCRQRRVALWQKLDPPPESDYLLLSDPIHLMYLANFWVDPFSLGAGYDGYLLVRRDGHAKLLHDNRLPKSVEQAHVDPELQGVGGGDPEQLAGAEPPLDLASLLRGVAGAVRRQLRVVPEPLISRHPRAEHESCLTLVRRHAYACP